MATLQEYLNQRYPTREDKERVLQVDAWGSENHYNEINFFKSLEGGKLDLREFKNVKKIEIHGDCLKTSLIELNINGCSYLQKIYFTLNNLTFLDLSNCFDLRELNCSDNNFTSIDFLNKLSNPEKLKEIRIYNNNIQSTSVEAFNRFENLEILKMGTTKDALEKGKRNKFYGSFESWKNLSRLRAICIEATDIDSGLEYLSNNLAQSTASEKARKKWIWNQGGYANIECSPHDINAKCSATQDQLKKYDYDLEAWQLAHPHLMYKARPELFFDPEVKNKWLSALRDKINRTQERLNEIKESDSDKVKKIKRLESKIRELKLIQENISNHSLVEKFQQKELVKKEDKSVQTNEIVETKQTEQEYQMPGSWKWK